MTENEKMMQLMMHLHLHNHRQGPGSDETTRFALRLAGIDRNRPLKIADIGCGTGAQTLTLAQELQGEITAVDLFPEFLEQLKQRIEATGTPLSATVRTLQASMDTLPFGKEEFDLIWSEGAVYNIGFRNGISLWKEFLKPGGILAVSEISWTTHERPQEIEAFWTEAYPEIDTVSGKLKVLEETGYRILGHFILPPVCWMELYYIPLVSRHATFLKEFGEEEIARQIVEGDKLEIALYEKYKEFYSYGFYVAQKI